jgi:hypothetical protein
MGIPFSGSGGTLLSPGSICMHVTSCMMAGFDVDGGERPLRTWKSELHFRQHSIADIDPNALLSGATHTT